MASSFEPDLELSEIISKLWDLDVNRCVPDEDYKLDLQGYVTNTARVGRDYARYTLFYDVNKEKIFEIETYKRFIALLNNYESETGQPEVVTDHEYEENIAFLDACMETELMQEAHKFLVSKGKSEDSVDEFKQQLYKIWFKLYRRTRGDRDFDSSGFEHVFVGETRDKNVTGFHNWIQFFLQEELGNVDYKGYFRRETSKEEHPRFLTLQFEWKSNEGTKGKPIGGSFIGTSPEFELALYTICFLVSEEPKVFLKVDDYEIEVTVYRHVQGIGTAYPTTFTPRYVGRRN